MTTTDVEDDLRRIWVTIRLGHMRSLQELADRERRDLRKQAAVLLEQAIEAHTEKVAA